MSLEILTVTGSRKAAQYDGTNGSELTAVFGVEPDSDDGTTLVFTFPAAEPFQVTVALGHYFLWIDTTSGVNGPGELSPGGVVNQIPNSLYALLDGETGMEPTAEPDHVVQFATGVTDSDGLVTFTWSPEFPEDPVITLGLQTSDAQIRPPRIVASDAQSTTVHVTRSQVTTLLGIELLRSVPQDAQGVTVHVQAVSAPGSV